MNAWIRLALVLGLSLALSRPAVAQISGFEEKRSQARADFIAGLEEHSEWCRGKKMFLSRKAVIDLILVLEPQHDESMKALGYKLGRDGAWSPPRRPKKFKDFKDDLVEEAEQRLDALVQAFLADLHAFLADPKITRDQRLLIYNDILPVDPEDATMRAARGEVKSGVAWLLRETVDSVRARESLNAALQAAAEGARQGEASEANPLEAGLGLIWTSVLQTPEARVLGTVDAEELAAVSSALAQAMAAYQAVLNPAARPPMGFTAFLLGDPEERIQFLNAYPNLPDADRESMAKFSSTWIDRRNHAAVWMETPEERLDGLLRLLFSQLLARDFRISQNHAWIHEGFGLFLTEAVTGTRITWFVQPEDKEAEDGRSIRGILMDSTDWRDEAGLLFRGANRPRLGALIEKSLSSLELIDLLHAYIVAAYLAEGFPGAAAEVARAVGVGKPARPLLEEALGRTLDEADRRVLRWLAETGHGAEEQD